MLIGNIIRRLLVPQRSGVISSANRLQHYFLKISRKDLCYTTRRSPIMEVDEVKRQRITSESTIKTIGTHNGTFHCDEVTAVVMLQCLPEFKDSQIIRTRDEELLKTCDIVVDVGSVYDPDNLRFDHHQKTFSSSMSDIRKGKPWTIRLSSAGLIWAHYGEKVISEVLEKSIDNEMIPKIFDKMYENFVQEIDAIDNGVSICDGEPRYRIMTGISSRVGKLNASWKEVSNEETEMENFHKAMDLVRQEFLGTLHHYADDWWEAYSGVLSAVESRFNVDPSGHIIELPSGGMPWRDHLEKIEESMEVRISHVIFQDQKGQWRVQCVPISPKSFELRVPLKEDWRGLRGKELEEVSQIPTINFVHMSGFIGGAAEKIAVIEMAKKSLSCHNLNNGNGHW